MLRFGLLLLQLALRTFFVLTSLLCLDALSLCGEVCGAETFVDVRWQDSRGLYAYSAFRFKFSALKGHFPAYC